MGLSGARVGRTRYRVLCFFWNSLRFGRKVPEGGKQNELVEEELRNALNLNAFHSLNIQVYIPSKTATTTSEDVFEAMKHGEATRLKETSMPAP